MGPKPERHIVSDLRAKIEALADALTEDNAYDDAVLASSNVSVEEARTYPAIISERTDTIRRIHAALETGKSND
jgi:hypothetical protein